MSNGEYLSIYVHIPFCRTRCFYCDFNTTAGFDFLIDPYIESLKEEILAVTKRLKNLPPVHSMYFGGGTPSILPADKIGEVIVQARMAFQFMESVEISMEMNPIQLTEEYIRSIQANGVNRISMGMQSASPEELRTLGRRHTFEDVINSYKTVREAGIDNINLDIIFGLPGQHLHSFKETLEAALSIHPPHLSLYALTVEEGTPLAGMIDRGELPTPDPDIAGDMYELAMERLASDGYYQYEISNWAIDKAHECRHNLQYWRNKSYLGFGAGAHSHYGEWRWENVENISNYIEKAKKSVPGMESMKYFSPTASKQKALSRNDDLGETMMMGLRLTREGVSERDFQERFRAALDDVYQKEIDFLMQQGLLEWVELDDGRHLRLTKRGRMLGNQVFMRFLRD